MLKTILLCMMLPAALWAGNPANAVSTSAVENPGNALANMRAQFATVTTSAMAAVDSTRTAGLSTTAETLIPVFAYKVLSYCSANAITAKKFYCWQFPDGSYAREFFDANNTATASAGADTFLILIGTMQYPVNMSTYIAPFNTPIDDSITGVTITRKRLETGTDTGSVMGMVAK